MNAHPTSPAPEISTERIVGLDGLRAISIFLVLLGHASQTFLPLDERGVLVLYLRHVSSIGVRVFLVISGFLITHLLLKERAKTGSISLKRFYIRRVLRIFPAFYTFIAAIVLLRSYGWIETNYYDILLGSLFLTNYDPLLGVESVGHH